MPKTTIWEGPSNAADLPAPPPVDLTVPDVAAVVAGEVPGDPPVEVPDAAVDGGTATGLGPEVEVPQEPGQTAGPGLAGEPATPSRRRTRR